jgi:hypothetical protein
MVCNRTHQILDRRRGFKVVKTNTARRIKIVRFTQASSHDLTLSVLYRSNGSRLSPTHQIPTIYLDPTVNSSSSPRTRARRQRHERGPWPHPGEPTPSKTPAKTLLCGARNMAKLRKVLLPRWWMMVTQATPKWRHGGVFQWRMTSAHSAEQSPREAIHTINAARLCFSDTTWDSRNHGSLYAPRPFSLGLGIRFFSKLQFGFSVLKNFGFSDIRNRSVF